MDETSPHITGDLGAFIATCESERIPTEARKLALSGIVDCCGVLVAGSMEPAPLILEKTLASEKKEARLFFGEKYASVPEAAWINATAAHALDFDDVAIQGHPSAVMVPAIIAEAGVRNVTGSEIIEAFIVGYEVWAELVLREPDQHHRKGWHPTGLFGSVGAAAACARLAGLNAKQASTALALAASQSAGLIANFGSMAKPFHAGRAAHAGVMSARLAASGMTASTDALEHPQGLLMTVSPENRVDLKRPVEAGRTWNILRHGLNIKHYPTCYSTSRGLDGIRKLMAEHGIKAQDVARVTVSMSRRNALILRHHKPVTALEAKFSMEFAIAAALLTGGLTLAELTDEFVQRADVRSVMEIVNIEAVDQEDLATGYAPCDTVSVKLHSGGDLEIRVSKAEEVGRNPSDALFNKFKACLAVGNFKSPAAEFYDALIALDQPMAARHIIGKWL